MATRQEMLHSKSRILGTAQAIYSKNEFCPTLDARMDGLQHMKYICNKK